MAVSGYRAVLDGFMIIHGWVGGRCTVAIRQVTAWPVGPGRQCIIGGRACNVQYVAGSLEEWMVCDGDVHGPTVHVAACGCKT
jgi:hypothetical protein